MNEIARRPGEVYLPIMNIWNSIRVNKCYTISFQAAMYVRKFTIRNVLANWFSINVFDTTNRCCEFLSNSLIIYRLVRSNRNEFQVSRIVHVTGKGESTTSNAMNNLKLYSRTTESPILYYVRIDTRTICEFLNCNLIVYCSKLECNLPSRLVTLWNVLIFCSRKADIARWISSLSGMNTNESIPSLFQFTEVFSFLSKPWIY